MPDYTSAIRIILLPSGQIIWSTCDRTRSHVKSCVRRPFWNDSYTNISSLKCNNKICHAMPPENQSYMSQTTFVLPYHKQNTTKWRFS